MKKDKPVSKIKIGDRLELSLSRHHRKRLLHPLNKVLILPRCVKSIKKKEFYGNCTLKRIIYFNGEMPNVSDHAFGKCISLTSIESFLTVPYNKEYRINDSAKLSDAEYTEGIIANNNFSLCESNDNTIIGSFAFSDCINLSLVELADNISKISTAAFQRCVSLRKMILPSTLEEISDCVFVNCHSLFDLILPPSIKKLGCNVFDRCISLTKISLPYTLESIPRSAFSNCISLEEIIIPKNVTTIESFAFCNCYNLKFITILGTETKAEPTSFLCCIRPGKILSLPSLESLILLNGSLEQLGCLVVKNAVTVSCDHLNYNSIPDVNTLICMGILFKTSEIKGEDKNGIIKANNQLSQARLLQQHQIISIAWLF